MEPTHSQRLRAIAREYRQIGFVTDADALEAGAAALEAQAGQEGEIGREALALVRSLYEGSAGLDWQAFTEQAAALLSRAGAVEGEGGDRG